MGPKVKEERGYHLPPIRMAVRVVVKLTGAGSESQGSSPSEPRERAGQAPHGALAPGSRGGTERPLLAGLPAGPKVPPRTLFARWAKGIGQNREPSGGPAVSCTQEKGVRLGVADSARTDNLRPLFYRSD